MTLPYLILSRTAASAGPQRPACSRPSEWGVEVIVGVPAETYPDERRVALIPAMVPALAKAGLETLVEPGAGAPAGYPDSAFESQGARIAPDRTTLFSAADVLVYVHGPDAGCADLALLRDGQVVIGLLNPLGAPEAARDLAAKGVTAFALELVPAH